MVKTVGPWSWALDLALLPQLPQPLWDPQYLCCQGAAMWITLRKAGFPLHRLNVLGYQWNDSSRGVNAAADRLRVAGELLRRSVLATG